MIREVLATYDGAAIEHRGTHYTVTMPPFPGAGPPPGPLPIYVAAVNVRMAEVAGACADGVLGHPMTAPTTCATCSGRPCGRGRRRRAADPRTSRSPRA